MFNSSSFCILGSFKHYRDDIDEDAIFGHSNPAEKMFILTSLLVFSLTGYGLSSLRPCH